MPTIDIEALSHDEQEAVRLAMGYWHACWDWECPTLMGVDFIEFDQIFSLWPNIDQCDEEIVWLAVIGSLRELLIGPSEQPESAIQKIIRLPYRHAALLLERLSNTSA